MLAGEDGEEDVLAREDGRDRVDAARKRLAEEDHVGLDVGVVLEAEELARARETLRAREGASASGTEEWVRASATHSLDLVADEEDVVLAAERLDLLEVVLVRNDDAARRKRERVRLLCGFARSRGREERGTHPASP